MSDGNPDILVTETQFAAALAEASSMDEESLKAESGSGQARSYFVRHGGRLLPLKAVLRLAYQRAGVPWNGVQSELAARRLRNRFEVLHLLDAADEPNTPPQPDFGPDPESTRVYIANFGESNALWPIAKANQTIITIDNVAVHGFWQAGDRDGYIAASLEHTFTALGKRPSRQTAGRWYNLVTEMQETEGDIWISRQGDAIWWTISEPGALRQEVRPSTNANRDGPEIWHIEKPCQPWSDRDRQGRPLRWEALHAKARDFLSTEATFQTIANDRGYADYARALVNGDPLDPWHNSPLFKEKAAASRKQGARIFSPKERAAARMFRTMLDTVAQANGQTVERQVKEKTTSLNQQEWEELLRVKLGEQGDLCALTGLPLGYDGECEDKELLASLDRIDSNGHYTADNVQIVCRFMNRWKGADEDGLVRRLLEVLQGR